MAGDLMAIARRKTVFLLHAQTIRCPLHDVVEPSITTPDLTAESAPVFLSPLPRGFSSPPRSPPSPASRTFCLSYLLVTQLGIVVSTRHYLKYFTTGSCPLSHIIAVPIVHQTFLPRPGAARCAALLKQSCRLMTVSPHTGQCSKLTVLDRGC